MTATSTDRSPRSLRMKELSVNEAATAYAEGSHVFVTRIAADQIDAIEQLGWRLENVTESIRPSYSGGATLFCVFVRRD